jgi:hypothetical protein
MCTNISHVHRTLIHLRSMYLWPTPHFPSNKQKKGAGVPCHLKQVVALRLASVDVPTRSVLVQILAANLVWKPTFQYLEIVPLLINSFVMLIKGNVPLSPNSWNQTLKLLKKESDHRHS